jgi:hypothetical protein
MRGAVKVNDNRLRWYSSVGQLGTLDTRILFHLLFLDVLLTLWEGRNFWKCYDFFLSWAFIRLSGILL